MSVWLWTTVVAAGAAGQFVDALAGMGFGALSSTVMLSAGVSPAVVVGTVNLAKIGSGLVSSLSHWRFGNVRWSWAICMAIPALVGGSLAAFMVTRASEQLIRLLVPVVLLMMGLLILRRFLLVTAIYRPVRGGSTDAAVAASPRAWQGLMPRLVNAPSYAWLGLIGLVGGALNGLSGAFGPFATSAVVLKQGGHPRYAIGTVNFVEFFVAVAVSTTILTQLPWGQLHWGFPVALMAGSVVTAPIGAYLSRRLRARVMGVIVGLVLVALNAWIIARLLI